jgi:hypothetical protein
VPNDRTLLPRVKRLGIVLGNAFARSGLLMEARAIPAVLACSQSRA